MSLSPIGSQPLTATPSMNNSHSGSTEKYSGSRLSECQYKISYYANDINHCILCLYLHV